MWGKDHVREILLYLMVITFASCHLTREHLQLVYIACIMTIKLLQSDTTLRFIGVRYGQVCQTITILQLIHTLSCACDVCVCI